MKKNKLIILLLLVISCLPVYAQDKSISTVFTANIDCFAGFSKKNVINCVELQETEIYNAEPIYFKFDPVNNYYYTDMFWAYCQGFTRQELIVTLSAPLNLSAGKQKIPYEPKDANVEGMWNKTKNKWTYTATDPINLADPKPRVVMSKPIQLIARPADPVDPDLSYSVEFTLKVETT